MKFRLLTIAACALLQACTPYKGLAFNEAATVTTVWKGGVLQSCTVVARTAACEKEARRLCDVPYSKTEIAPSCTW